MATYRESDPVDDELTPAQIRELRRRMADLDDGTRYLLVSQMGPRFALYYNVSDDVYVMNDPRAATLFKRRKAALAVKALLGGSISILRCRSKRVNGVRVPILGTTRSGRASVQPSSSNQGMKQAKLEYIGASQLIPGVGQPSSEDGPPIPGH